jgi:hypothetical protein
MVRHVVQQGVHRLAALGPGTALAAAWQAPCEAARASHVLAQLAQGAVQIPGVLDDLVERLCDLPVESVEVFRQLRVELAAAQRPQRRQQRAAAQGGPRRVGARRQGSLGAKIARSASGVAGFTRCRSKPEAKAR